MIVKLKRAGPNSATVTIKAPINAAARNMVDAEVAKVRSSVVPIIAADKRGRPYVAGSAVAIVRRDVRFLVTAEHVMSDHEGKPLSVFASDGLSRPFGGNFIVDLAADLAAKQLSAEEVAWLEHIPFLKEDALGTVVPHGERFYASVVGYPSSAARRMDRTTLDTRMESYSNWAVHDSSGLIDVLFDKKEGARTAAGHGQARDQYGKSGGAVFGIALAGAFSLPLSPARLVGIATRWRRTACRIRATNVERILQLLDGAEAKADPLEGRKAIS